MMLGGKRALRALACPNDYGFYAVRSSKKVENCENAKSRSFNFMNSGCIYIIYYLTIRNLMFNSLYAFLNVFPYFEIANYFLPIVILVRSEKIDSFKIGFKFYRNITFSDEDLPRKLMNEKIASKFP